MVATEIRVRGAEVSAARIPAPADSLEESARRREMRPGCARLCIHTTFN